MKGFHDALPMMLYRALKIVLPRFRAIFAEAELTEPQWRIMRILWEDGCVSFGRLAELSLVPRPSLVGVIDRLESRKLIKRIRSTEDRRRIKILLTEEGAKLRIQVLPKVERAHKDLLGSIEPDDWNNLYTGLNALLNRETNNQKTHE